MARKNDFTEEILGFLIVSMIAGIWFTVAFVIELIKAFLGNKNVDA